MIRKLVAECAGTFLLVLGGCGAAVLAGEHIGVLGVALAFGFALSLGICALGSISGGHFNPAVSLGLWAGGRFSVAALIPYILAQVAGALAAAYLLMLIAHGRPDFALEMQAPGVFATNGFDALSPVGLAAYAAFATEVLFTTIFVAIIMCVTRPSASATAAPFVIGLALALIHAVTIPLTNTSVNPARSTGVALLVMGGPFQQLWLFWAAPMLGGLMGGLIGRWFERTAAHGGN